MSENFFFIINFSPFLIDKLLLMYRIKDLYFTNFIIVKNNCKNNSKTLPLPVIIDVDKQIEKEYVT
ncbi:5035_t:CDS:2 [Rhizophagus irregularis]|nr:5035_t:CDS:2 [Rhizophagus irregularis]